MVLILFGGARVAGLGGAFGRSIREFRENIRDEDKKPPAAPEKTNAGGMLKCRGCGAQNPGIARFCASCGRPLGGK